MTAEGADQFLGIPYAAPPVGALRWQGPQPEPRWQGVRQATSYGSPCAQLANGNDLAGSEDENCLTLNVYSPPGSAPASQQGGGGLPVMVMINGGGLTTGSGDQYDGSLIVTTDRIIVVSINYRLGPLGYLDVPGLGTTASTKNGNYGLLDQEAALRWVRRNIAAFGGDPAKVTIDGESAGGWSVCALLASPPARGLFRSAIMQSGSCSTQSPAAAQAFGLEFATAAGCPDPATAAACLRALPTATLLNANQTVLDLHPTTPYNALTYGGPELPVADATAVSTGQYDKVPLLIGTNHNEGRTFSEGFADYTEPEADALVTAIFGAKAPAILARYPWSSYPSPYTAAYMIGDILTDSGYVTGVGGCPEQTLASQFAATTPTYFYQFDDLNAPGLNDDYPGYQWGAGHAMELAYLWPSFNNGIPLYAQLTPAQLELSQQMVKYWGAFVSTGRPQVGSQPAWPQYTGGPLLSLRPDDQTQTISTATFEAEHQCSFWNAG
jgi:para-nitrobenzyl esterase